MSRIGKNPVAIPDKVQVTIEDRILKAKGPKGELTQRIPDEINYVFENNTIIYSRSSDVKRIRALHGLTRALTANVMEGVLNGYIKTLLIEGVGYKAELRKNKILLSIGFSHLLLIIPPVGVEFEVPNANTIKVKGIDKQLVGQVSARIRKIRPPEPYKGKGIRYEKEQVRRKAGKTAA